MLLNKERVIKLPKSTDRNHLEIRMNCQNLNLKIKGELPLPHSINIDDGISKPEMVCEMILHYAEMSVQHFRYKA